MLIKVRFLIIFITIILTYRYTKCITLYQPYSANPIKYQNFYDKLSNELVNDDDSIINTVVKSSGDILLDTWFIENKGMIETAKKFVKDTFLFLEKLSDEKLLHKHCNYARWKELNYHCVPYKKKYIVAYLDQQNEIVICDFVLSKLLK